MSHTQSLIVICPLAALPAATALGVALGWSENELSVPLSPSGNAPATHRALHAWARPETAALFRGEVVPDGADEAQLAAILASLTVSIREGGNPGEHFDDALTAAGLTRVEP